MIQRSRHKTSSFIPLCGGTFLSMPRIALYAGFLVCGASVPAAQAQNHLNAPVAAQSADAPAHPPEAATGKAREPAARISKFEARRFRHACQERANEHGLKGSEREGFLTRCFFGRRAQRGARKECTKQGAAKNLDKAALHEFVRECLKEQQPRGH